jgi:amidase
MARTVKDAAYLLTAMAQTPSHGNDDFLSGLKKNALQGVRLGFPMTLHKKGAVPYNGDAPPDVYERMQEAIKVLESLGATVLQDVEMYQIFDRSPEFLDLWATHFKEDIEEYLNDKSRRVIYIPLLTTLKSVRHFPTGVRSLTDLIEFNNKHPELERPPTYESQG